MDWCGGRGSCAVLRNKRKVWKPDRLEGWGAAGLQEQLEPGTHTVKSPWALLLAFLHFSGFHAQISREGLGLASSRSHDHNGPIGCAQEGGPTAEHGSSWETHKAEAEGIAVVVSRKKRSRVQGR